MKREQLIDVLNLAAKEGVITDVVDLDLRDIRFKTVKGLEVKVEWYVNLLTIHLPGFSMWADDIFVSSTHPCYKMHVTFSYQGNNTGFVGVKYDHLEGGE